jgi:hypothetical protein
MGDRASLKGREELMRSERPKEVPARTGDQFGDLLIRPIGEKSIGATGFEPAT